MSLQSLNNQHRAAIIAKDVQLANQIAAKYHPIWHKLLSQLAKLLKDMQTAEQNASDTNTPFNAQVWLLQFHRLDTLLQHVDDGLGDFAQVAHDLVQTQLEQAWNAGEEDGLALLHDKLGDVRGVFGKPNPEAIEQLLQRAVSKQGVANLFSKMDRKVTELVRKRLIAGVSRGEGPRAIARDIARALNIPLSDALRIARTESISAYRDASLNTYRANADVVQGWTWSAAAGACPFCQSMDGTHHDLSESMDSHPNCRCTCLPDTISYEQILQGVA